jgi:glycine/D-amino acid oxidase-like deaminating enzyme
LVWVSGRAPGAELGLAQRARNLGEQLGELVPAVNFRSHGSLTLASGESELALLKEAAARPDARERGFELLDPTASAEINPALRGEFAPALWCSRDAIVEPRAVPFDFDVDELPYDHLRARAEHLLGTPVPATRRRWVGVYSQVTGSDLYHRSQVALGVTLVTGPGGRGMTCSPAIAEETFAA